MAEPKESFRGRDGAFAGLPLFADVSRLFGHYKQAWVRSEGGTDVMRFIEEHTFPVHDWHHGPL
jgi:hypothetical protein